MTTTESKPRMVVDVEKITPRLIVEIKESIDESQLERDQERSAYWLAYAEGIDWALDAIRAHARPEAAATRALKAEVAYADLLLQKMSTDSMLRRCKQLADDIEKHPPPRLTPEWLDRIRSVFNAQQ